MRIVRGLSHSLIAMGLVLCGTYVAWQTYRGITSRLLMMGAQDADVVSAAAPQSEPPKPIPVPVVSFKDWSAKRIAAYKKSLISLAGSPVGVLRIPRISLEAPMLEGTDNTTLDRGAGLIEGTAVPGSDGNSGIAGHRDGFFRVLKDIQIGDKIVLSKGGAEHLYVVDRIVVVNPKDTWVLADRGVPSLTLVTCFPFYGVGPAPQRFIVQAALDRSGEN